MIFSYFKGSVATLFIGLTIAMGIAWSQNPNMNFVFQTGFTALLLAVLEISLSFDNAVVNATIIKKMSPVWRHRFLTWGILIAVFGMRLIFPLLIVAIMAHINPIEALVLSFTKPDEYAQIMLSAHLSVASFGGFFLFMVFLKFFIHPEKDTHWIHILEKPLVKVGEFIGADTAIGLMLLIALSKFLEPQDQVVYLVSGLWGIITYLLVHSLADWLENLELVNNASAMTSSAGLGIFLYLEVLDASFSFDGVIGAFALTNSLVQIMIGLGIGAFFVRSLTIYFVEKNTLEQFKFLEHGAFYALGALAFLMFTEPFFHTPEWVTGLVGAFILATSVLWSIYVDRKSRA